MPYRPQKRRASRTRNGNGKRTHHRGSYAARLAIARSTRRKQGSSGPNAVIVLLLILMVSGVSVASAAAITAGGAATMALATLDEGLPDVESFTDLDFNEQSIMYSRDGVQLAQFWDDRRSVIDDFDDIPKVVLDATTATEDDTFWDNPGVDLEATIGQLFTVAGGGDGRGASTITQQLVRAVLLPEDVLQNQFKSDEGLYERKAKEILQAYKLTQAFPGEKGKEEILKAYLNQIPYGGPIHGIQAAARVYLGKNLSELTMAEAALLAAIPQEPGNLYPYKSVVKKGNERYVNTIKERYGKPNKKTGKRKSHLVIRQCGDKPNCVDTELVRRQHFILNRLGEGKGRWLKPSTEQIEAAKAEKIVIQPERRIQYKAPQFVSAALNEVTRILGNDYDPVKVGGYKIKTTLDYKAQKIGEKYVWAGAIAPNLPISTYYKQISQRGLQRDRYWIDKLRPLGVKNGALVAMDYRTGDILAYVASANAYARKSKGPKFDPDYDHIGLAKRQPGSAWKPIVYASGIDNQTLTAGTILLDITTPFGGYTADGKRWAPKDADSRDRGPIQVRDALQQSLNVPAIRALDRVGVKNVRKYAVKAGFEFLPAYGNKALDVAGLAGAIGTVEVRPLDMTSAFGGFGNSGRVTEPRYVLEITGPKGERVYEAGKPVTTQVWSPQTAYIITDILKGNTDPRENAVWADIFELRNTKNGARREAAVKTGTTNNLKDYSTYGYLPKPKNEKLPALAVGVWYGNSDSSQPNLLQIYSMDNAGRTWHAFVREYMNNKAAPTFKPPKVGVVTASITKVPSGSRQELFVRGTQPGGKNQVDPSYSCGSTTLASLENPGSPASWYAAVSSWAGRSVGSSSQWGSIKAGTSGCFGSGGISSSGSGSSSSGGSSSGGSSSGGSSNSGGGGGGGGAGNGPAPTCQPGFTNKPRGCVIPG